MSDRERLITITLTECELENITDLLLIKAEELKKRERKAEAEELLALRKKLQKADK